jgi:hypothetical protein
LHIFLHVPRPFLESRVQVAIPMLSALLSTSEDFHLVGVHAIEFLGDELPVEDVGVVSGNRQLLPH